MECPMDEFKKTPRGFLVGTLRGIPIGISGRISIETSGRIAKGTHEGFFLNF